MATTIEFYYSFAMVSQTAQKYFAKTLKTPLQCTSAGKMSVYFVDVDRSKGLVIQLLTDSCLPCSRLVYILGYLFDTLVVLQKYASIFH